jgi:hypothetical protein
MADKKITLVLEAKNMLSRGLSGASQSVKKFSDGMKGAFDFFAKPILIVGAGLMALKKGLDVIEEGFRGMGRAFREAKTESMIKDFELLRYSASLVGSEFKALEEATKSGNAVFDQQTKRVRGLEDAQTNLEKAKRLSTATTDEERQAIEEEFKASEIATEAKRKQADIELEVSRAKDSTIKKTQEANKLTEESAKLEEQALEARTRAAAMGQKINALNAGASMVGVMSGVHAKEIESLTKAQKAASDLADKSVEEKERIDAQIVSLGIQATEAQKMAADKSLEIENTRIEEQASILDLEAKNIEKRMKMQEEASKKLADLKEKEADTLATIAERQTEDNKDKWDQILRDNEEAAKKTVAQFIEDSKKEKDDLKVRANEDKNAARLEGLTKGGGKLSKKDQEWLDSFKAIRDAQQNVGVAKENIAQIEATKQTKALTSIQDLLKKNLDEQLKLSTAG